MSVYDERCEELEKQEFMMRTERGRPAVTLDLLTGALVLVGRHGVCQSAARADSRAIRWLLTVCLPDLIIRI